MAVIARASVTLSCVRDIESVTWYYRLQASTAAAPSKPTAATPTGWTTTEPSYTDGSTNSLYVTEKTVYTDGTFAYSDVSLSSSYEAAKTAYNKAASAVSAAEQAQSDIDNLEIGGTNMLPDSNVSSFARIAGTSSRCLSDAGNAAYASGEFITIDDPPVTGIQYGFRLACTAESSSSTGVRGYAWNSETLISLVPGGQYTMSCYVRRVSGNPVLRQRYGYYNGSSYTYPSGGFQTVENDDWKQVSFTFTFPENAALRRPIIYPFNIRVNSVGTMEACGFKLEHGNRATAWTPSPWDVDSAISSIETDVAELQPELIAGTHGTTATAAWTGTSATLSAIKAGTRIQYKLSSAGASNVTLDLTLNNGATTGAKEVYFSNTTRLGTQYAVNTVINLVYDGSVWRVLNPYTNTNYYDRTAYKASVTAAGAIAAGRIGVFNAAGKLMLLGTTAFDITCPILYVGTAYTATALTQTNNYTFWGTAFSLANTKSGFSGTAGKPVYIVGTLSGKMFTPDSAVITTTEPTTEDGKCYIRLGLMSTTVNAVLEAEHPIYRYYGGAFRINADAAQSAADGKNAVYYASSAPTGGTYRQGDIWFDTSDGNAVYTYTGSAWEARALGDGALDVLAVAKAVISYLDVGSLTAADITALLAVFNKISSKDGKNYWDLDSGLLHTENGEFTGEITGSRITGSTFRTADGKSATFDYSTTNGGISNRSSTEEADSHVTLSTRGLKHYRESTDGENNIMSQIIPTVMNSSSYGWYITPMAYIRRLFTDYGEVVCKPQLNSVLQQLNAKVAALGVVSSPATGVTGVTGRICGQYAMLYFANFSFTVSGSAISSVQLNADYYPALTQDLWSTLNSVRFSISTSGWITSITELTASKAIRGTYTYLRANVNLGSGVSGIGYDAAGSAITP